MNQHYRGQRGGPGGPRQPEHRPDYRTMTHYYDAQGRLKPEVFVEWPRQVAGALTVSRTNLRRAYDFVAAMRFRIAMGKEDPASVLQPGMGQLYRFIYYQAGRDRNWEEAKSFFELQCSAVRNDPRQFEGFYQLFQSVMAYLRR